MNQNPHPNGMLPSGHSYPVPQPHQAQAMMGDPSPVEWGGKGEEQAGYNGGGGGNGAASYQYGHVQHGHTYAYPDSSYHQNHGQHGHGSATAAFYQHQHQQGHVVDHQHQHHYYQESSSFTYEQRHVQGTHSHGHSHSHGHGQCSGGETSGNFYGYYQQHQSSSYQGYEQEAVQAQAQQQGSEQAYFQEGHQASSGYPSCYNEGSYRYNNNSSQQGPVNANPTGNGQAQATNSNASNQYNYHNHQQHSARHHHPPFRRKSLESYKSYPETPTPNYSSPTPSPSSSTSPAMVKRECVSNPPPPTPTPPIPGWVRNTSSNSSASSNNCSSTTEPCYPHSYNSYENYMQQPQPHLQQQQQQFKSCAFEDSNSGNAGNNAAGASADPYSLKPCAVKQRSLSIPAGMTCTSGQDSVQSQALQYQYVGEGDEGEEEDEMMGVTVGDLSGVNNLPEDNCDDEEDEEEEEEDDEEMDSSLLHEFDVDDIPESDMIIAEEDDPDEEQEEEGQEDQDQECENVLPEGESELSKPQNAAENPPEPQGQGENLISDISASVPEKDVKNNINVPTVISPSPLEEGNTNSNSSSSTSFSSTLFSLKRSNSISYPFGSSSSVSTAGDGENPQGDSGISLSLSFALHSPSSEQSLQSQSEQTSPAGQGVGQNPQKISKRSYSDSDKDQRSAIQLHVNVSESCGESGGDEGNCVKPSTITTDSLTLSTLTLPPSLTLSGGRSDSSTNSSKERRGGVVVPKGWKREISFAKDAVTVYYVSPSDTKLRNLDELKNYICSDGTCKCGLSCPLRLDNAFSFDPKVITLCAERPKQVEAEDELMYLTGFKEREEYDLIEDEPKSTLCNHYKRKIPKSVDSPLISSTREDLGDCSVKPKKRRTSDSSSEFSASSGPPPGNATPTHPSLGQAVPAQREGKGEIGREEHEQLPPRNAGKVPVPCSQQSPDTTTQTPQTEMSPASSVSSETSNSVPTSSSLSSLSRNTPTPPSSSGKATPPGVVTRSAASASSQSQQSRKVVSVSLGNGQGKNKSPCPNVDVRQLTPEQNPPPPAKSSGKVPETPLPVITIPSLAKPESLASQPVSGGPVIAVNPPAVAVSATPTLNPPASISSVPNQVSSQVQNQNPPCSQGLPTSATLTPTTTSCLSSLPLQNVMSMNGMNLNMNMNMNMNGFTFSPLVNPTTTMSILPSPLTLPTLDFQKLLQSDGNGGFSLPQFQPQVLFSIPNQQMQMQQLSAIPLQQHQQQQQQQQQTEVKQEVKKEEEKDKDKDKESSSEKDKEKSTENLKKEDSKDKETEAKSEISKDPSITDIKEIKDEEKGKVEAKEEVKEIKTEESSKDVVIIPVEDASASVKKEEQQVQPNQQNQQNQPLPQTLQQAPPQIILQNDQFSQMRYPIIQTIQPFFSTSTPSFQIISQPTTSEASQQVPPGPASTSSNSSSSSSTITTTSQQPTGQGQGQGQMQQGQGQPQQQHQGPFLYSQDGGPPTLLQDHSSTQILMDPTTFISTPLTFAPQGIPIPPSAQGGKKKKKRLSKKQQQQQAQLQLQQQLIIQQIQAQQAAMNQFPLTIFPQSFPLSLQPFNQMPFFQPQTILTLPNLILNPADGTLFIQQGGSGQHIPVSSASGLAPQQTLTIKGPQGQTLIAPKAESGVGGGLNLQASEDRRNPTPDSSTGDVQVSSLGGTLMTTTPIPSPMGHGQGQSPGLGLTTLPPASGNLGMGVVPLQGNKAKSSGQKGKVVSSTNKRIFQKQILPKIDSTTPSND